MKDEEWPVQKKLSFLERSINEIEKDPNLYKHFCEGEKNGYSDWMYECNSDCD